jgi:hypothetical protein
VALFGTYAKIKYGGHVSLLSSWVLKIYSCIVIFALFINFLVILPP